MTTYYRGFLLRDVRRFADWADSALPGSAELPDETVVFLREDLTVVRNPVLADQEVLWDSATPQWRAFCEQDLRFELPDDLRAARA
ncbi:hypothetical protein [Streptomyces sp. NRRL WC-3742]|uniref:hypothetical protein n=1 Tax=Streptomyces sp. NRRL WC-3742 TaxID=1463934 RepID=UPI0004C891DF|nr:hypothetical protein [Streptomyces sp. NRRL WC-3742]